MLKTVIFFSFGWILLQSQMR